MNHRYFALSVFCLLVQFGSVCAAQPEKSLAPGYKPLPFKLPQPGTYALPGLGQASDGKVLDTSGSTTTLHKLYGDKLVLLSFIYSTCSDVNGCPLATAVLHKIQRRLAREPQISEHLRLITLSFNPLYDSPEVMAQYGNAFAKGADWHFLTAASEQEIEPILTAYGQSVQKDYDADGKFLGTFSHVLRVFLIDRDKQIRNIYTVSFLHPDTLVNDIKTLLAEKPAAESQAIPTGGVALLGSGDNKSGYEAGDFVTRSIALTERSSRRTNLMAYGRRPPLGLPPVPTPSDNPLTPAKIELGRKLFFDRRLSLNNTFSCAMCHIPEQGFSSNELSTAVGIEGRTVRRNSPTLYNVAYLGRLFHDGRENRLEQQVWGPLLASNEMGAPSVGYVVDKIGGLPDYAGLFEKAFKRGPTMETIGMALASYQRTLNSADSPFDRWHYGRNKDALPPEARLGFELFTGKAGCAQCHTIAADHALFTDQRMHNTGIGFRAAMTEAKVKQEIQAAPGVTLEVDAEILAAVSEVKPNDLGLYEITQDPGDRWKYRTPSLRNIALTAPYMHDGSLSTLEEVIEFYNRGGIPNENLDPLIKPLNLNKTEVRALVALLESLTGSNVPDIVSDAFAAPVGNPSDRQAHR
ncbi:cytochrome-c peroxidase [Methylocaldum marinum]|uniref:Methylamine utilization protein MauG n=1 Tax=Methylocaldum marinum TaxID=1432792 RepID=A0A250KNW7_9GAMM|nr:cytochrome c peroxidase [Methylocaldum marinum]BBA33236.1 cytochrome-c peroxidase [Methylocaldum marinum]